MKKDYKSFIGKIIKVIVDRPIGSRHPKYPEMKYGVNYGYVPGVIGGDGEELDVYILGIDEPLKEYSGECIAIIQRINDDDDKLVVCPKGKNYSDEEIKSMTDFQEKYFKSIIVR